MSSSVPLSVIIITKNEQDNIKDCLLSVHGWADEIIIVDDNSTDDTTKIARNYTDKVFIKKMEVEGTHRNWAYAQSKNDWILSLDADERVTPELQEEIRGILSNSDIKHAGFAIPRRNYIGDYWVKHGGWYPGNQMRMFRKGKFKYEEVEVHPRAFLDGTEAPLKCDMIHYSYEDFADFLRKLNGQSTLEARKWISTDRKMSLGHAIWRTGDRFLRSFFRKKAFKDGFIGFMVAYFASLYQMMSYAKYWEMKRRKTAK